MYLKVRLVGVFACLLCATVVGGPEVVNRPITSASGVVAVIVRDWGKDGDDALMLGLWPDGHIAWSGNDEFGGPPYFISELGADAFTSFVQKWRTDGLFDELVEEGRVDPHGKFIEVLVNDKTEKVRVVFSVGYRLGDGTKVESEQSPSERVPRLHRIGLHSREELLALVVWNELQSSARKLAPIKGELVRGEVVSRNGRMHWVESK